MTTYRDLLVDDLNRAYERFGCAFEGVTVQQANRFPAVEVAPPIKSMTWLTWHTARVLDVQIAELANQQPVWDSQGWSEKLPSSQSPSWSHSLEEAQAIQVTNIDDLLAYFKAAKEAATAYLQSLTESDLDDIVDDSWTPAVSRGVRLVSTLDDVSMHSGQVFYARRLLGLTD